MEFDQITLNLESDLLGSNMDSFMEDRNVPSNSPPQWVHQIPSMDNQPFNYDANKAFEEFMPNLNQMDSFLFSNSKPCATTQPQFTMSSSSPQISTIADKAMQFTNENRCQSTPEMATPMNLTNATVLQVSNSSPSNQQNTTTTATAIMRKPKVEAKPKSSRKRKRKKQEYAPTPVTLDRKTLLKMTCEELDKFAAEIASKRELTQDEVRDIKRQRRLIKNRESALASRVRKKEQVEVMSATISQLEKENASLKQRVSLLEKENMELRNGTLLPFNPTTPAEDIFIDNSSNNSDVSSPDSASSYDDNSNSSSPTFPSSPSFNFWDFATINTKSSNPNVNATGAILMIMLFSFGLFFSNSLYGTGTPHSFGTGKVLINGAPNTFFKNNVGPAQRFRPSPGGMHLLQIDTSDNSDNINLQQSRGINGFETPYSKAFGAIGLEHKTIATTENNTKQMLNKNTTQIYCTKLENESALEMLASKSKEQPAFYLNVELPLSQSELLANSFANRSSLSTRATCVVVDRNISQQPQQQPQLFQQNTLELAA